MTKSKARPKWTVHYNIANENSPWIGTGWEFFDFKRHAQNRYMELNESEGRSASLRPYYEGVDFSHLGAVHRM